MDTQHKSSVFTRFARWISAVSGRPATFALALLVILVWAVTGPLFGFSDTWQLVINTGTTIVTFLMVFLIQNTQNRDTEALQIKLDELIRSVRGARNEVLDLEEMDEAQLDEIRKEYLASPITPDGISTTGERNRLKGKMRISFRRSVPVFLAMLLPVTCLAENGSGQPLAPLSFEAFLTQRFQQTQPEWKLESLCPISTSAVAARVFREYGSVFVAADSVKLPPTCIYPGESDVIKFQKDVKTKAVETGGIQVSLQESAAYALQRAIEQAGNIQLTISPLDGAIAGSRSYGDTLRLWNGRFFRALDHWIAAGRLTEADRLAVTGVELQKRIEMILQWETQGIYFSTDRTRSIFTSTAPPGASQHLSMLAFDIVEYGRPEIREIMNRNGWYQTVVDDPPHFTFLGVPENELPSRGLLMVQKGSHRYWIPNLSMPTR